MRRELPRHTIGGLHAGAVAYSFKGWANYLLARTKRNLILRIVGSPTTLDRKQPIYDIVSVAYSSSAFSHATAQPSLMMKRWFLLALSLKKLFPSHPL